MLLERAARWAAETATNAPLPEAVSHDAKRAVVDWFAAAIAGGGMAPARILARALVGEEEVRGRASLVPSGDRVGTRTAALINGTAAHTAEVDDIFKDGVYHPGAPTIAAALAVAQDRGCTGQQFLRAVVVGFEIGTRIAAAVQPAHYRYWHTTGTVGAIGAAAAASVLVKPEEGAILHAMATSATMASGLQQAFRSDAMSKPLHAGHAADAGTLSALAAAQGFTGVSDILEGDVGFGAAMSDAPPWDGIFDDLGDVYNISAITFKNHACCGHTFAAIDGALEVRTDPDFQLDEVEVIEVATYGTAIEVTGNATPHTPFEAQFSLPYCVAAALKTGSVRLAAFEDDMLNDTRLRDLASRVKLEVDPVLDGAFPQQRGARVAVRLADGTTVVSERPTRRGDPDLPLSDEELTDKFKELAILGVDEGVTADLLAALWGLEGRADMADVLPEPVGSP